MRAVLQRVTEAAVQVSGEIVGQIGPGMMVLIGVGKADTEKDVNVLVDKISQLRIFEDADGMIWMGFWGGGIDRFDPKTETFTHFKNDLNNPNSLSDNRVVALYKDRGGIVWAGYWADASSPRNVLMWGCGLSTLAGFLLAPLIGAGSLFAIGAFLALMLLLMGFVYGPLGAWLPGLFPARVRYTGASIAFNVGGIIGGGLTPLIAEQLVGAGGLPFVGYYLSAATALSFIALLALRKPSSL